MKYLILAEFYQRLEKTSKKLEKRDILAELYKKCSGEQLPKIVLLSMGVVFTGEEDLGVAKELVKKALMKTCGINEKQLAKKFKETGDLGLTEEYFIKNRRQSSLFSKSLTAEKVFENLRKLPSITGQGSVERKLNLISELLASGTGLEGRYITRTVLGDMRIGVAEGIVRDAIAAAFSYEPEQLEKIYNIIGDYGEVALQAKNGILEAKMKIGSPIRVMLADRAKNMKEALEEFEAPAIEVKYDGFRIQCHKSGSEIRIFSRRTDEVTRQFPDIVRMAKENIKADKCIIEGEAVAIDKKTESPRPFQLLSRRIKRKYDIEGSIKEIPVQVNLFDLLNIDEQNWMEKPLKERWERLKQITHQTKYFRLAGHIETKDFEKADRFYKESLASRQEGVIVKNLKAIYQPGKRVGFWLKVKKILEPLDLVVVGAEWGEGKRAGWLGSFILACKDGDKFVETGRMASGLTEIQMEELTKQLKKIIISEEGRIVKVKPEIVVEIGYEELQKSPKYPSGYALRFPRLLRIRVDEKKSKDANTLKDIEKIFRMQKS